MLSLRGYQLTARNRASAVALAAVAIGLAVLLFTIGFAVLLALGAVGAVALAGRALLRSFRGGGPARVAPVRADAPLDASREVFPSAPARLLDEPPDR